MLRLSLAAVAALAASASSPVAVPPPTACASGATEAAGFVTNPGPDLLVIAGPVRFVFETEGSMSRPMVVVQAQTLVQPGETARVATARLEAALGAAEICRFDVSQALSRSRP
ncbi:MAG: hypothetical protein M0D55_04020 [Elusimicrobiota bacterium]|nr:MAG: hypothetical protein M0D55_04020 [Elusimicrobiota bacterium]